jgi:hypothetical protein
LADRAPAVGQTWIVDDSGGAGVDFTDIPSAIAAASGGDLIVVRAGSDAPLTLDKPLVVRGEAGVIVAAGVVVAGLVTGSKGGAVEPDAERRWSSAQPGGYSVQIDAPAWSTVASRRRTPVETRRGASSQR